MENRTMAGRPRFFVAQIAAQSAWIDDLENDGRHKSFVECAAENADFVCTALNAHDAREKASKP